MCANVSSPERDIFENRESELCRWGAEVLTVYWAVKIFRNKSRLFGYYSNIGNKLERATQ